MQCLKIQSKVNISLETGSSQSRGSIRLWRSSLERGAFVHFCLSLLKFCLVTGVLRSYEQGFWVTSRDCRVSNGNEVFLWQDMIVPDGNDRDQMRCENAPHDMYRARQKGDPQVACMLQSKARQKCQARAGTNFTKPGNRL